MAHPLPPDVKKQAEEKCAADYPYLTVQDPGTVLSAVDGRKLLFVLDNRGNGLWLEIAPPPVRNARVPSGLNSRIASSSE